LLLALLGVADNVVGWAAPVSDGWKEVPAAELPAGEPSVLLVELGRPVAS